ncbi:MAG: polysaccharide biosynthesis/export family protein [Bryobacteraceae bacterium]|nr:polysaccharide biosynthesis/export family protein [Bryobacteraceae bacterium]MDW8379728.1 polysaccharide biosynthesis/export family protein [Bryobacterales bacterium]
MSVRSGANLLLYLWVVLGLTASQNAFAQKKQSREAQKEALEDARPKSDLSAVASGPGAPVDPKTYKIGPEDILGIRVWREPELSGPVLVRPDGKISLPLVGEIQAGGETPESLAKLITESLSKVMTKPEVFVSVQQVNSKRYYVTGEVNKPGVYSLVTPVTVLEAISLAGGLREFADQKKIVIVRGNQRLRFNYKEVVAGKNLKQNITVEPGDNIIVP